MRVIVLFAVGVFMTVMLLGQGVTGVDRDTVRVVVRGVIETLKSRYVFPDKGDKMAADLKARLDNGEYDKVKSPGELATLLTKQMRDITHDMHLHVDYSPEPMPKPDANREMSPDMERRMRDGMRIRNYGFERAERLGGNVGYLDMRMFVGKDIGADTASAAMNFLANCDALIIDLRKNGGGDPAMVAWVCSYLFKDKVHLNDLYFRPSNSTEEFWTDPSVPGTKFLDKDVYVLTSKRTFSGAEEFCYNLKNLKRATLIGETTGGGAHPGEFQYLSEHFGMFIATGRAISPITKTNWEGTGVAPDISVSADAAYNTAYVLALENLQKKQSDPDLKKQLGELIEKTRKEK